MTDARLNSIRVKAKLLQKSKARAGKPIKLKDAYEILAKAAGFASWRDFKRSIEQVARFFPRGINAHWSTWYATHQEAYQHVQANGGYLLPHEKHFLVCDMDYLMTLGLEPDDPDILAVGYDWTQPNDSNAFHRILQKIGRRHETDSA